MKNGKLAGKIAVVTGASKGIGADIAKQFAAEGAAVVVNYASSKEDADRVVDEIAKRGGKAIAVKASVAKKAEIERLFSATKKAFGKIDILVNNAGVYDWSPLEEITEEQFHKDFDVNVLGLLLATQEAVKHFDSTGGNIINISSTVTSFDAAGFVGLHRDKRRGRCHHQNIGQGARSAQNPRQRHQSRHGGTEGVRAAGFDQGDLRKSIEAQTPLGRIGQPEDIAPAAVFLASSDSAWITGETVRVAGGLR